MEKRKFLLLLGANQFQRERALIGAEKVFDGYILTVSSSAPFLSNKCYADVLQSNEREPEILLKDVIQYSKKTNSIPAAVVPLNDFVLNAGLAIAEHFHLPYNSANCITTCRTKDLMKNVLIEAGLPVVPSFRFQTTEEAYNLADKVGYPVVVKPLNFGGSGGVIKVMNKAALKQAITDTFSHIQKYAKRCSLDLNTMLIEPYITTKREISVEVINTPKFCKVVGITDKFLGAEPYFSEIGHLVPSRISEANVINKIIETAQSACTALGIKYGMAHVEMKVDIQKCDVTIIEVGARTAGDGIMDLYEKSMRKNIYGLHCKAFLNTLLDSDIPSKFINGSAIGYLHPNSGIVENIKTTELSPEVLKNVDFISVQAEVGQPVLPPQDFSTRYGFVEYTIWNDPTLKDFDLLKATKKTTEEIFSIQ